MHLSKYCPLCTKQLNIIYMSTHVRKYFYAILNRKKKKIARDTYDNTQRKRIEQEK